MPGGARGRPVRRKGSNMKKETLIWIAVLVLLVAGCATPKETTAQLYGTAASRWIDHVIEVIDMTLNEPGALAEPGQTANMRAEVAAIRAAEPPEEMMPGHRCMLAAADHFETAAAAIDADNPLAALIALGEAADEMMAAHALFEELIDD